MKDSVKFVNCSKALPKVFKAKRNEGSCFQVKSAEDFYFLTLDYSTPISIRLHDTDNILQRACLF